MTRSDLVRYAVAGRVALVTVNDPDRRNAVTDAMSAQLAASVRRAELDPEVHAVVVTGAGRAFCAGADLSALDGAAEDGLLRLYDGFMAVANCRCPPSPRSTAPPSGPVSTWPWLPMRASPDPMRCSTPGS